MGAWRVEGSLFCGSNARFLAIWRLLLLVKARTREKTKRAIKAKKKQKKGKRQKTQPAHSKNNNEGGGYVKVLFGRCFFCLGVRAIQTRRTAIRVGGVWGGLCVGTWEIW